MEKNRKKKRPDSKQKTPKHKISLSRIGKSRKAIFLKNLILAFLLIIAVFALTREGESYHWFYKNLLKSNFEYITGQKGEFDLEKKYSSKLRFNYVYLDYLKKNTPEDAIILMPNKEVFLQENSAQKFNHHMAAKGYTSFFLYPRQVVYEREKGKNALYDQVSHIAIVNKWGYDKLNYSTPQRANYAVLAVNP